MPKDESLTRYRVRELYPMEHPQPCVCKRGKQDTTIFKPLVFSDSGARRRATYRMSTGVSGQPWSKSELPLS